MSTQAAEDAARAWRMVRDYLAERPAVAQPAKVIARMLAALGSDLSIKQVTEALVYLSGLPEPQVARIEGGDLAVVPAWQITSHGKRQALLDGLDT